MKPRPARINKRALAQVAASAKLTVYLQSSFNQAVIDNTDITATVSKLPTSIMHSHIHTLIN